MEEYCQKSLAIGVHTLCFTDHLDNNGNDRGFMFYDPEAYFRELEETRMKYGDRLALLSGIEFSEPHQYPDAFQKAKSYPYDFILGSVHFFYNDMFPSEMQSSGISAQTCFLHYWDEVLSMVVSGGFDCVGHLDFPKRYYGRLVYDEQKIREIFRQMLRCDLCPEINTSGLRKGLDTALPDLNLLTIYKDLGGKYVTVGSDAHNAGDLGAGLSYAKSLIRSLGLQEVLFKNRERIPV
jgi:histidinol-phosphatase (PHP family)